MRILITGASGFIGSTLIWHFNQTEHEVFALMRSSSNSRNLEGLRFEKRIGDLRDPNSLRDAVRQIDVVIHLAGAITAKNREEFFAHNAGGTENLARAVAEMGVPLHRFIYVSSLAAAGPAPSLDKPRFAHLETLESATPVSVYGESKLGGERALVGYKEQFPIAIVRPPIVYGPRDRNVLFLVKAVATGLVPRFPTSGPEGKKYYSAIHAEDLCQGILKLALAPPGSHEAGEIFYLCSDEIFSDQEFMGTMAEAIGRKYLSLPVPRPVLGGIAHLCTLIGRVRGRDLAFNRDKLNELLPDYWICSNANAKKKFGFEARYSFRQGMRQTIEWYKEKGWI